jgi:hypothetical protein
LSSNLVWPRLGPAFTIEAGRSCARHLPPESPLLRYVTTSLDAGRWRRETDQRQVLRSVLEAVLPLRNPEFEERFDDVCRWLLEVDGATGLVSRELGLDADDRPIVAAPLGENVGFWAGTNDPLDWRGMVRVDAALFESAWGRFAKERRL